MFLFHPFKSARAILKSFDDRLFRLQTQVDRNDRRLHYVQETLGRIESRQLSIIKSDNLNDYEFRVFSQWGEDGIIQHLIRHIDIPGKSFVEFGVQDYREANTRFLLVNNNWSGLVMDGSAANVERITKDTIYWAYDVKAVQAFVTQTNINELLRQHGVSGEIGILSIDIDGNDFWIWRAIEAINPIIVVIEYNYRFGRDAAVTIPYKEDFDRAINGHGPFYFGASLQALCWLAKRKGYVFVGCCSNGVNAFFVRHDKKPQQIRELSPEEGYFEGKFSETVDNSGVCIKTDRVEENDRLMKLDLVNVNSLE